VLGVLAGAGLKKLLNYRTRRTLFLCLIEIRAQGCFDVGSAMELAFATKSLRDICESAEKARHTLGPKVSEKLKRRLADLYAAVSVNDLIAGRPHELDGPPQRRIALELGDGHRLVFSANHVVLPKLESGKIDWSKVSRVKLLRIETDS
jgi:hypothetical protein